MNYSKVENHPNLIRDLSTNAIIDTNQTEYENYLMAKKVKEIEVQTIKDLEDEVKDIKNDLNEIKNLLRNLANGTR